MYTSQEIIQGIHSISMVIYRIAEFHRSFFQFILFYNVFWFNLQTFNLILSSFKQIIKKSLISMIFADHMLRFIITIHTARSSSKTILLLVYSFSFNFVKCSIMPTLSGSRGPTCCRQVNREVEGG